jgi:acyl-CoA thioesterase-1
LLACFSSYGTPTILVLGDSLSAAYQIPPEDSWVKLLENKLKSSHPQATVINSSIVGDTTANGLQRLPSLLEKYHPQILILELGGNDGLRGLSVESIKANLDAMITQSLQANVKVLLVAIKLPPNYGPKYTKDFYEIYGQLQNKHHISLVPFFLENVVHSPKLMFEDHIHPTSEAQPILLDNIWPHLSPLLTE